MKVQYMVGHSISNNSGTCLVTRSIQQVYVISLIVEGKDSGCNGDAPLLFQLHPV